MKNYLSGYLVAQNPRRNDEARICVVSLPVPPDAPAPNALGGLPTQVQPIAWWPRSVSGKQRAARRQLMFGLSAGTIPQQLRISRKRAPRTAYDGPQASLKVLYKKNIGMMLHEEDEAAFSFKGKTFGLRLGLIHGGEYHWWEWLRIEELWSGPLCRAVRIGGFIPRQRIDDEQLANIKFVSPEHHRLLHEHHWLRGEAYVWMFANGVIRFTCRHVNNHLFDHGKDLTDVVPIIAFSCAGAPAVNETLDGSKTRFDLGSAVLDLREAASVVSPEHPGRLSDENGVLLYRPYEGVEIAGDPVHKNRPDGYIVRAHEKVFPKGAAKTIHFAVSLGEAAPVISRLTVPDWWYAATKDIWVEDYLPVHSGPSTNSGPRSDRDALLESLEQNTKEMAAKRVGAFDDGVLTKNNWEGEIPYSLMFHYYLSGEQAVFDVALNDAYHNADFGFDHATETFRMHGYPFGAIAPPLYRTVGLTFGYLETGDPYLLDCAESAAVRYYQIDRHNWPRRTYGRDAASLRSLIFLWDYTGKEDYLAMAREALGRAAACQRPDGSTGDQGGAVGIQGGMANELTKPWMAMLAADPVMDYLLRRPGDRELEASIRKTADFILASQIEKDGQFYWAYQYKYGDNPADPWEMRDNPTSYNTAKYPYRILVAGYKARFLVFMTELTGETKYIEAWQKCWDTYMQDKANRPKSVGYSNKFVQNLPFELSRTWNARLKDGALHVRPVLTPWSPKISGTISTPLGPVHISCAIDAGRLTVETRGPGKLRVLVHRPGWKRPKAIACGDKKTFPR